jgi:pimeloyl-ACP methyl ester carboxylesterase
MHATDLGGFDERHADVKGVRIRFFVGGTYGSPVLLLHGLGGAASNWVELAPLLARRHRVIVPELPGHGGSSPLPAAPNLDVFAERVGIVSALAGCRRAAVVGHSLGALVAMRLAVRRRDDVTALVLAGAAGISSTSRRAEKAIQVSTLVRPGRLLAPHRRRIGRSPLLRALTLGGWGVSDPLTLSPSATEGFLAGPALHTDTGSAGAALVLDDVRPDLGGIRSPCLVLWGARDRQTPMADAIEFARRLRAPLRTIPDCGHLLIGERPEACFDAIESFLAATGAKGW